MLQVKPQTSTREAKDPERSTTKCTKLGVFNHGFHGWTQIDEKTGGEKEEAEEFWPTEYADNTEEGLGGRQPIADSE